MSFFKRGLRGRDSRYYCWFIRLLIVYWFYLLGCLRDYLAVKLLHVGLNDCPEVMTLSVTSANERHLILQHNYLILQILLRKDMAIDLLLILSNFLLVLDHLLLIFGNSLLVTCWIFPDGEFLLKLLDHLRYIIFLRGQIKFIFKSNERFSDGFSQ